MAVKYEIQGDDSDKTPTARIKILEGKFENFIFNFGVVKMNKPENDDEARCEFTYDIFSVPQDYPEGNLKSKNESSEKDEEQIMFEKTISDILYDIIVNQKIEKG